MDNIRAKWMELTDDEVAAAKATIQEAMNEPSNLKGMACSDFMYFCTEPTAAIHRHYFIPTNPATGCEVFTYVGECDMHFNPSASFNVVEEMSCLD